MSTVVDALLSEIERVSAKRERWRQYARDPILGAGSFQPGIQPGIALMTAAIEAGKKAISENDAALGIAALEDLRGFDSDD